MVRATLFSIAVALVLASVGERRADACWSELDGVAISAPAISYGADDHVVVVWTSDYDVHTAFVVGSSVSRGDEVESMRAEGVSISAASNGSTHLLAGLTKYARSIELALLDAEARILRTETIEVSEEGASPPVVAHDGAGYVVAWSMAVAPGFDDYSVHFVRVGDDGVVEGPARAIASGSSPLRQAPAIASSNGVTWIAWSDDEAVSRDGAVTYDRRVRGLRLDSSGSIIGDTLLEDAELPALGARGVDFVLVARSSLDDTLLVRALDDSETIPDTAPLTVAVDVGALEDLAVASTPAGYVVTGVAYRASPGWSSDGTGWVMSLDPTGTEVAAEPRTVPDIHGLAISSRAGETVMATSAAIECEDVVSSNLLVRSISPTLEMSEPIAVDSHDLAVTRGGDDCGGCRIGASEPPGILVLLAVLAFVGRIRRSRSSRSSAPASSHSGQS